MIHIRSWGLPGQRHRSVCRRPSCRGSLALEAALLLPVILVLLIVLLAAIDGMRRDLLVQSALDQVASELALLSPALDEWQDLSDQLLKEADQTLSWSDFWTEILPPELTRSRETLETWLGSAAMDLASSALLQNILQNRLEFWLSEQTAGQGYYPAEPRDRQIFLDWETADHQLWLTCSYQLSLGLFSVSRSALTVVPLWSGWQPDDATDEVTADAVWMLDNFSRGKALRQRFGANLPDDFPVIARFLQGEATMIHSIDLTAPTYQNPAQAVKLIQAALDRLQQFTGARYVRQGQTLVITAAEITSRRLILVIPANYDAAVYDPAFAQLRAAAQSQGITLVIVTSGNSQRYAAAAGA